MGNFTKYLEKKTEFEFADIICLNETTFFSIVGEEFVGNGGSHHRLTQSVLDSFWTAEQNVFDRRGKMGKL